MRLPLACVVLGGCLYNPTVDVDKQSVDVARGTSSELYVSIDGEPVLDVADVYYDVLDPTVATVTPSFDRGHLRIGGNLEGTTIVRVSAYGHTVDIPTLVGPPAIIAMWADPGFVHTSVGETIQVRARALDTIARVQDITFDARWTVRDWTVANIDRHGMMLHAMSEGSTTLHVTHGTNAAVVPITIFK